MAETPDQYRSTRPRPAWEARLDAIDERLDSLASQVSRVLEAMASDQEERRATPPPRDLSRDLGVVADRVADVALDCAVNREVLQRLDGAIDADVVARIDAAVAQIGDSIAVLVASVDTVRGMVEDLRSLVVANGGSEAAVAAVRGLVDQIDSLDRRMVSRSDIDELRQRVEQAEVSLADQANMIGTALRRRIDDQRTATGEVGAQLSNLMATSGDSIDLPDKVRREVRKEIEELAEHLGVALSDLRLQLTDGATTSLPALTTGLDRISGRIEADTQRLSAVVASANDRNDERLRRLDAQVTELRQRLELLRLNRPLGSRDRAGN